jgi:hypothetical protein
MGAEHGSHRFSREYLRWLRKHLRQVDRIFTRYSSSSAIDKAMIGAVAAADRGDVMAAADFLCEAYRLQAA